MKLCDLDEMLKTINPFKSLHDQYMYNSIKTLGKMCEVKAIPIEWIKTEKEKYPFYYQDGIDLLLFKWEEYSTRKIWEKENDKETKELYQ